MKKREKLAIMRQHYPNALTTVDADVRVSGSGDVRVGPTGKAVVDISGSGDVDLTRRATEVSRTLSGSGDIDES